MQKRSFLIIFASLILFSLGLSHFGVLHSQALSFTILDHDYRLPPAFFLIFLLVFLFRFNLVLAWLLRRDLIEIRIHAGPP